MPILDEVPGTTWYVVGEVMAFDVVDPYAHDLRFEAEPLVVVGRPDRAIGSELPSHRVLGAFDHVGHVITCRRREEMRVP